jgi:hypothetical protein
MLGGFDGWPDDFRRSGGSIRPEPVCAGAGGAESKPSHAVVVNLDYKSEATCTIAGPGRLDRFDTKSGEWIKGTSPRLELRLQPGDGVLVRAAK